MKCILLTGSALLLALLLLALLGVMVIGEEEDQFLSERRSEDFTFTWNKNITVHGTIWFPSDGSSQGSITALVHGDGPSGRTAGDGYNPLINALLDRGIAVASWDKPGIGESGGNWLDQSMSTGQMRLVAPFENFENGLKILLSVQSDSLKLVGYFPASPLKTALTI